MASLFLFWAVGCGDVPRQLSPQDAPGDPGEPGTLGDLGGPRDGPLDPEPLADAPSPRSDEAADAPSPPAPEPPRDAPSPPPDGPGDRGPGGTPEPQVDGYGPQVDGSAPRVDGYVDAAVDLPSWPPPPEPRDGPVDSQDPPVDAPTPVADAPGELIPDLPAPTDLGPDVAPPDSGSGQTILWAGAGDIASCSHDRDLETAELLDRLAPDVVFTAGDNAYPDGTAADFSDCYDPTWGRHLAITRPVPGNHEYNSAGAAPYFAYFGAAAGDPSQGWHAYDVGTWRVYALNSECWEVGGCDLADPQQLWLEADLDANPRTCVAAHWHRPRYSSGEHGGGDMVDAYSLLYQHGAELVVVGHDHDYERFAPQDDQGGTDVLGIVEVVVGTGGASQRAFNAPEPNSLVRLTGEYGVLACELGEGTYACRFVRVDDAVLDEFSGSCR